MANHLNTQFLVKVNQHFGIGARPKDVAPPYQIKTFLEFDKIVNLAVVNNMNRLIFIAHRHMTGRRQIYDRQAAASEAYYFIAPYTTIAWTAMGQTIGHPVDE